MRFFTLLLLFTFFSTAQAADFRVDAIKINGNKKISNSTVLTYLPFAIGDRLNDKKATEVIKALYKTGFFESIEVDGEGNTVILNLVERSTIKDVKVTGNKVLDDTAMEEALSGLGISKGKFYDHSILDRIQQELKQLYYSLGKYSARINATVDDSELGVVIIKIDISEGLPAKVRDINITGNSVFSDDDLLSEFKTTIPSQSFFGSSDDYSQAKMAGDLDNVRATYLDNGYLDFNIDSSQVTISEDRKDINVAVNLDEGEQYRISDISLSGKLIVKESQLLALISFKKGDIFSRKQVTQAIKRISKRLGEEGYAFTNVNALPKKDEKNHTVALDFIVDPGQKMNVRFITFHGNEKTMDEVLRREMRQMESAPFSASKVDRSKIRLQRLKYVSGVVMKFKRVKGEPDQMDISVNISERFSGSFSIGVGYSEAQGALLNLSLSHDNVFGTGKRIGIDLNNSRSQEKYTFSYTNPYYTQDGISRGFSFSYAKTDATSLSISNYILDQGRVAMNYDIPMSEYNSLGIRFGYQLDELTLSTSTSAEVFDFIIANNDKYTAATDTSTITQESYDTGFISTSYSFDTRNRVIFPDEGYYHAISLELFGGDLEYYKLRYRNQFVIPINKETTFSFKTRLGQGDGINGTSDLPFYEKFYAGGTGTVRGYDYNSLGPKDSKNLAFGGNTQVVMNAEVLIPLKALGDPKTFRVGFYYDAGNVFADPSDVAWNKLKTSIGISAKWYSPVGPLEFSYSTPLNADSNDTTRNFQFSLGTAF